MDDESPEPPAADEPTEVSDADLRGLKRGELDVIAEELGVENVADIPNAPAVVDAIIEARKEADNG